MSSSRAEGQTSDETPLLPRDAVTLSTSIWGESLAARRAQKNIRAGGLDEIKYHHARLGILITPRSVIYTKIIIAGPHRPEVNALAALAGYRVYLPDAQNPVLKFVKFVATALDGTDDPGIDACISTLRHVARSGFNHAALAHLINGLAENPGETLHAVVGDHAMAWVEAREKWRATE